MDTDATTMPALDKIAPALAMAQAEMSNPPKTKTANAGKYKYKYADLAEIIDHVRPVLGRHKLAVSQIIDKDILRTVLMHESGQTIVSHYGLPKIAAAQEMGSAITYARRYSLCAILGIAAEEDDDGQKAEQAWPVDTDAGEKERDELIERMGRDSIGPVHIMAYVKAHRLGLAVKDLDALSINAVRALLEQWPAVVESAKPKAETPPQEPQPASTVDVSGIDPALAKLMEAEGITKAMLKAYYSGAGHVPATVEPEKLPAAYIKAITSPANWTKAVHQMKGTAK